MEWLSRVRSALRNLHRGKAVDHELDSDVRAYLQLLVDERVEHGESPEAARRAARLELGGVEQVKEHVRDARAGAIVDNLLRDVRDGWRALRRTPGVTAVAVLSLALGIGASTSLFSVLYSLLLRSLPVREPAALALLSDGVDIRLWTYAQWQEIEKRASLFDGVMASGSDVLNLATAGELDLVNRLYVSGDFFGGLGVRSTLGRLITRDDDRRDGGPDGPVAVLSHACWQSRFGGAPNVIGRMITLDRIAFTIIGVAEPGFRGISVGETFDVAVPLATEALVHGRDTALDRRSYWWLSIMTRLRSGQTLDQATSAIRAAQSEIREATRPPDAVGDYARSYLQSPLTFEPGGGGEGTWIRTRYRLPLITLFAAAGLLLLIACVNIANLMMARGLSRRHELAVRAALGASKLSLARPLLIESLLLSACGTLCGLVFAQWAARALLAGLFSSTTSFALDTRLDVRVVAFAVGLTILSATICGTVPAFRSAQSNPNEAFAERGRSTTGRRRHGVSAGLIVTQVALSLVLIVFASLSARTFAVLTTLDPGFDREPILMVQVDAGHSVSQAADATELLDRVRLAARAVPGVRDAALSVVTPVAGGAWQRNVQILGGPPGRFDNVNTYVNVISPGWLAAYGVTLVAGRDIDDRDRSGTPPVVLANETFARRFLPGRAPVGCQLQHLGTRTQGPAYTIVGVVKDTIYRSLRQTPPPTLFFAWRQTTLMDATATLSVRTAGPPVATLAKPLTAALLAVHPDLSFAFKPLADQVDSSLNQERLIATLSSFFGIVAMLLAAIGLYGVTAYDVGQRRSEVGVRMALGSAPGRVVQLMLRRVAGLVVAGLVVGSVVAYWAAGLVKTLVFGIGTRDPVTFVAAIVVMGAVGLVAGWFPARRASRVDPVEALREI